MADPLFKLARKIRAVEKLAFRAATQPQLAYSSIEDGAIQSVEDGTLKAIIGKQFDGTQAVAIVNGPPPPQPSAPGALAALEGAVISWDGLFADGSTVPMDFARVEAHVSTDPDFTAEFAETLKATFESPRGGQVFVSLIPATYYVKLVARNSSGGRSVVSASTTVVPQALSDSLPDASDGVAPASSPVPVVEGGVKSLFIGWDRVTNADPVTYEVHVSDTSGFTPDSTTLSGETGGTLHVIRTLPGSTVRLDYATPYYIKIVAKDVDGAAAPGAEATGQPVQIDTVDIATGAITEVTIADDSITAPKIVAESILANKIAANAVTADKIAANAVTADKVFANAITSDKLASLLVLASRIEVGSAISIDPASGITINLSNGGYIHLPADGTPAEFKRVILQATELVVEDKLTVNGVNNKIAGTLALNATVPPPSTAPTLTSVSDPSTPLSTATFGSTQNQGLGDNGTQWEIGKHYAFDTDTCISSFGVNTVDKSTGAMSAKYNATVNLWASDLAAASISTPLNDGWQSISTAPPTPVLTSFHSTSTRSVFVFYRPAWSGYRSFNVRNDVPTSFSFPAQYRIIIMNNVDGTMYYNWPWSADPTNFNYPAAFLDSTYVYIGGTRKATLKAEVWRYAQDGSGGTNLMTSVGTHNVNWTGLYVGAADFGATRYLMTYGGTLVHVWDSSGTYKSAEAWDAPNSEGCYGIAYADSRFYTYHPSSAKIRRYSTLVADTSRSVKYTWFNSSTSVESTAPVSATATQVRRQWLKVTAPSIPSGASSSYPDSVRIYIASKRQANLAVGALSNTYEIPTTSGVDAPATDGFATLGNAGVVQSGKTDVNGPIILLKGDGSGRVGPFKWNVDGTDANDTGWIYVGTVGAPAFQNSWSNYSSAFPVRFKRNGRTVRLAGWPRSGTAPGIFILPVGYRPSGVPATGYLVFPVLNVGGNVFGYITVDSVGQVTTNLANGTGASWPTLDAIDFDVDPV
jgi:hypothetical protein